MGGRLCETLLFVRCSGGRRYRTAELGGGVGGPRWGQIEQRWCGEPDQHALTISRIGDANLFYRQRTARRCELPSRCDYDLYACNAVGGLLAVVGAAGRRQ